MKYNELTAKPEISEMQSEILNFWKEEQIFEKSVNEKKGEEIVFYDGPPFPTGKPHHGTVLVSFIKDMIARYHTMRGHRIPRIWGWDCHGLPIENQAEAQLGINDKNIIEDSLGIDKFNEKCFEIVSANNDSWKTYVEQMARWVDYDGAYKTMDTGFMESVMWAFKTCYDKGLIYRDYRVTPYCMRCETSLSISDTRESDSTRLRQDRWLIAKFKTDLNVNGKPTYILAWTTTPWTLPSNLALVVGENLDYSFVETDGEIYVACTNTLKNYPKVFGQEPVVVKSCSGNELVGVTYEPLFPYFAELKEQGAFRVISGEHVGSDEGVGVVHTAPAFGEDDYWACKEHGIPLVNPVDEKGRFTKEITDFYDEKGEKNVIELNSTITRFLYDNNKCVADGTIEHNYPHCWRCKDPLIYRAMDAWYFDVTAIKDRLIELNEQINWVPETVKQGRFGKWLENARDWNISRNRYWSTPIPIWECEDDGCTHRVVVGSIEEIEKLSGEKPDNLHRQFLDDITFKCECCGKTMRRVPEVLDCWFESGSVPFAQKHYPFENKDWFESHLPSDFIVEYTGQIRCWFYYLHVLSVALFDKTAFSNCVVHGTILAKDGKKLSKSSKNYTDPMELMQKYGTDAYRLYLYQTNAMLIGDLMFDDVGIQEAYQKIVLPYWNSCNFYIAYANIDGFKPQTLIEPVVTDQLNRWILAKLYETEKLISENMDAYQVNRYVVYLLDLIDGLTNWFIRRSRRKFWSNGMSEEKTEVYNTLYYVLVNITKLLAPVAPIISEQVYKTLTDGYSVHLEDWPSVPEKYRDDNLIYQVDVVQDVISLARNIRNKNRIKNRQPLSELRIALANSSHSEFVNAFTEVIAEELNVKKVMLLDDVASIAAIKYDPNFNEIRNRYKDMVPKIIASVKKGDFRLETDAAFVMIDGVETEFAPEIILVSYNAKEGQHVASDRGIVVSLDITLTDELKQEGLARDIVRNIQDARKQIGCNIVDRIDVEVCADISQEWLKYIGVETLADIGEVANPTTTVTITDDNEKEITVKIAKKL